MLNLRLRLSFLVVLVVMLGALAEPPQSGRAQTPTETPTETPTPTPTETPVSTLSPTENPTGTPTAGAPGAVIVGTTGAGNAVQVIYSVTLGELTIVLFLIMVVGLLLFGILLKLRAE